MKKALLITTAVLAVVLGILAIGDLDWTVSNALINRHSIFGEFFNRIGEWPAMGGMLIGTSILFGARKKEVLWRNILGWVLATPFMTLFSFTIPFMPIRYIYEFDEAGIPSNMMILVYVLTVIVFIAAHFIILKLGSDKLKNYRKHGLLLILLIFLEMVLVNVVKIIWARPRMRSIETYDQFRKWYQIGGPLNSEEFKSFPSGHTANGFIMVAYSTFFIGKQNAYRWMTAFGIVWGTCVALSRVLLGAHFLSDVAVGGYITVILFYTMSGVFFRKGKKA